MLFVWTFLRCVHCNTKNQCQTLASRSNPACQLTFNCRPPHRTLSSAPKITLPSIRPPTFQIVVDRVSKTSMRLSSRRTRHLWIIRQAPRPRASSRTCRARHGHRKRPLQLLEGGEAYQQHGEEAGYPHVAVLRGGREGVGSREEQQEEEEELYRVLWRQTWTRGNVERCVEERKQYTTDSLLLSKS